jgi:hypothetical protein
MPEIKTHHPENKTLLLGNNEFETGLLTVPASTTIPAGTLLKRVVDKFAPVENTTPVQINVGDSDPINVPIPGVPADIPVAVNPVEIKNPGESPVDMPFRALVSGKVRQDMLSVNGQPVTTAQADMLRVYGILPRKLNDISRTEN